jgi:hypothetical protein
MQTHHNTQIYVVHPTWATSRTIEFLYYSLIVLLQLRYKICNIIIYQTCLVILLQCEFTPQSYLRFPPLLNSLTQKVLENIHHFHLAVSSRSNTLHSKTYYIFVHSNRAKPDTKVDKVSYNPMIYNCFPPFA